MPNNSFARACLNFQLMGLVFIQFVLFFVSKNNNEEKLRYFPVWSKRYWGALILMSA